MFPHERTTTLMIDRKTPPVESKLLILHALTHIGPCTSLQLLQFFVEMDMMDYITLQLTLGELSQVGQLRKVPHALGLLYEPTEKGREALAMFRRRIPNSKAKAIEEAAPGWRSRFAMERHILSDFKPLPQGGYSLILQLIEDRDALLSMTLHVDSRDMAQGLAGRWQGKAALVYNRLMETLGRGYEEGWVPSSPSQAEASIVREEKGVSLTLTLEGLSAPDMTVVLALPNENIACYMAMLWEAQAISLYNAIIGELAS